MRKYEENDDPAKVMARCTCPRCGRERVRVRWDWTIFGHKSSPAGLRRGLDPICIPWKAGKAYTPEMIAEAAERIPADDVLRSMLLDWGVEMCGPKGVHGYEDGPWKTGPEIVEPSAEERLTGAQIDAGDAR